MLKFVGIGSAFSVNLGNNSAYLLENNHLFLIDCGSNIFDRLLKSHILLDLNKVSVLVTHKHPDHIGSLGDLLYYLKFVLNVEVDIFSPKDMELEKTLRDMGLFIDFHYKMFFVPIENNFLEIKELNLYLQARNTEHFDGLKTYGYIIQKDDKKIYYSGDSSNLDVSIYNNLNEFDFIYQDISSIDFEGNPHVSYSQLLNRVKGKKERSKIFCMHLDNMFNFEQALSDGFNFAKISEDFLNLNAKLFSLQNLYSDFAYLIVTSYREYESSISNVDKLISQIENDLIQKCNNSIQKALLYFEISYFLTKVLYDKELIDIYYKKYQKISKNISVVNLLLSDNIYFNQQINKKQNIIQTYLN